MGRRTAAAGDSAPAGDARPIFFLRHQKENAPRPVEKKTCSAGRPAQAQPSCRRRGKVGSPLRQSETETRRPWGNLQPGEVQGYPPAPLPAAAHAPAKNQAAPSEAEGAETGADQIQFRTTSAHPTVCAAPGYFDLQCPAQGRRGHRCPRVDSHDSRPAQACRAGLGTKRLFFWTVHGPFSFRQDEKKMGGAFPRLPGTYSTDLN